MKYTSHYKIAGGLKHTFVTDNKIKTATPDGELVFSAKQKKQQKMVLEMMEFLLDITKKYKIKWFAICGTLLGAVRNEGIIPYDDDGDVGFLMSEYDKFLRLTTMDLHPKFEFIVSEQGFQLVQKEHLDYVTHFDMFVFDTYDDPKKLVYAGCIYYNGKPSFYSSFLLPKEWMYKQDVDKIVYRKFEHLLIPTPADPTEYLSHVYSPNCLTTYVPDSRNVNGFHLHELYMNTVTPKQRYNISSFFGKVITPFEIHKPNNSHLLLLLGRILGIPIQMDNNVDKSQKMAFDAVKQFTEANISYYCGVK